MHVLIIGYGKMGRIHGKHLTEMGVPWEFHDPHLPGGVGLDRLADCTHAIVATPIDTHYDVYCRLADFPGRILIEKPVVTRAEHLHVLDDERVFAGMCERFNPAVEAMKARARPDEIVALEFCRTSLTGDVVDVGIHDLDLFCHLLELRKVPDYRWEGDTLIANANGVEGRFQWPESQGRHRTITATTICQRQEVDLFDQRMGENQIIRTWPVARELSAFLSGECLNAALSHVWMTRLVDRSNLQWSTEVRLRP